MDIELAKKLANELNWSYFDMSEVSSKEYIKAIETVLSELEKKEAVINEMAKTINKEYYKDIIENYTKKVEKEGIKE